MTKVKENIPQDAMTRAKPPNMETGSDCTSPDEEKRREKRITNGMKIPQLNKKKRA